jgi:hypothetical protein
MKSFTKEYVDKFMVTAHSSVKLTSRSLSKRNPLFHLARLQMLITDISIESNVARWVLNTIAEVQDVSLLSDFEYNAAVNLGIIDRDYFNEKFKDMDELTSEQFKKMRFLMSTHSSLAIMPHLYEPNLPEKERIIKSLRRKEPIRKLIMNDAEWSLVIEAGLLTERDRANVEDFILDKRLWPGKIVTKDVKIHKWFPKAGEYEVWGLEVRVMNTFHMMINGKLVNLREYPIYTCIIQELLNRVDTDKVQKKYKFFQPMKIPLNMLAGVIARSSLARSVLTIDWQRRNIPLIPAKYSDPLILLRTVRLPTSEILRETISTRLHDFKPPESLIHSKTSLLMKTMTEAEDAMRYIQSFNRLIDRQDGTNLAQLEFVYRRLQDLGYELEETDKDHIKTRVADKRKTLREITPDGPGQLLKLNNMSKAIFVEFKDPVLAERLGFQPETEYVLDSIFAKLVAGRGSYRGQTSLPLIGNADLWLKLKTNNSRQKYYEVHVLYDTGRDGDRTREQGFMTMQPIPQANNGPTTHYGYHYTGQTTSQFWMSKTPGTKTLFQTRQVATIGLKDYSMKELMMLVSAERILRDTHEGGGVYARFTDLQIPVIQEMNRPVMMISMGGKMAYYEPVNRWIIFSKDLGLGSEHEITNFAIRPRGMVLLRGKVKEIVKTHLPAQTMWSREFSNGILRSVKTDAYGISVVETISLDKFTEIKGEPNYEVTYTLDNKLEAKKENKILTFDFKDILSMISDGLQERISKVKGVKGETYDLNSNPADFSYERSKQIIYGEIKSTSNKSRGFELISQKKYEGRDKIVASWGGIFVDMGVLSKVPMKDLEDMADLSASLFEARASTYYWTMPSIRSRFNFETYDTEGINYRIKWPKSKWVRPIQKQTKEPSIHQQRIIDLINEAAQTEFRPNTINCIEHNGSFLEVDSWDDILRRTQLGTKTKETKFPLDDDSSWPIPLVDFKYDFRVLDFNKDCSIEEKRTRELFSEIKRVQRLERRDLSHLPTSIRELLSKEKRNIVGYRDSASIENIYCPWTWKTETGAVAYASLSHRLLSIMFEAFHDGILNIKTQRRVKAVKESGELFPNEYCYVTEFGNFNLVIRLTRHWGNLDDTISKFLFTDKEWRPIGKVRVFKYSRLRLLVDNAEVLVRFACFNSLDFVTSRYIANSLVKPTLFKDQVSDQLHFLALRDLDLGNVRDLIINKFGEPRDTSCMEFIKDAIYITRMNYPENWFGGKLGIAESRTESYWTAKVTQDFLKLRTFYPKDHDISIHSMNPAAVEAIKQYDMVKHFLKVDWVDNRKANFNITIENLESSTASIQMIPTSDEFKDLIGDALQAFHSSSPNWVTLIEVRKQMDRGEVKLSKLIELMEKTYPMIHIFAKSNKAGPRDIAVLDPLTKLVTGIVDVIMKPYSAILEGDMISRPNDKEKILMDRIRDHPDYRYILADMTKWNQSMQMRCFSEVVLPHLRKLNGDKLELDFIEATLEFYQRKKLLLEPKKYPELIAMALTEVGIRGHPGRIESASNQKKVKRFPEIISEVLYGKVLHAARKLKDLNKPYPQAFDAISQVSFEFDVPEGMGQGIFSTLSSVFGVMVNHFILSKLKEKFHVETFLMQTSDDVLIAVSDVLQNHEMINFLEDYIRELEDFGIIMSREKSGWLKKGTIVFNSQAYDSHGKKLIHWARELKQFVIPIYNPSPAAVADARMSAFDNIRGIINKDFEEQLIKRTAQKSLELRWFDMFRHDLNEFEADSMCGNLFYSQKWKMTLKDQCLKLIADGNSKEEVKEKIKRVSMPGSSGGRIDPLVLDTRTQTVFSQTVSKARREDKISLGTFMAISRRARHTPIKNDSFINILKQSWIPNVLQDGIYYWGSNSLDLGNSNLFDNYFKYFEAELNLEEFNLVDFDPLTRNESTEVTARKAVVAMSFQPDQNCTYEGWANLIIKYGLTTSDEARVKYSRVPARRKGRNINGRSSEPLDGQTFESYSAQKFQIDHWNLPQRKRGGVFIGVGSLTFWHPLINDEAEFWVRDDAIFVGRNARTKEPIPEDWPVHADLVGYKWVSGVAVESISAKYEKRHKAWRVLQRALGSGEVDSRIHGYSHKIFSKDWSLKIPSFVKIELELPMIEEDEVDPKEINDEDWEDDLPYIED